MTKTTNIKTHTKKTAAMSSTVCPEDSEIKNRKANISNISNKELKDLIKSFHDQSN
ncbi:MAG: hypothetical protein ABI760_16845 [Ferruginibacter sp.]